MKEDDLIRNINPFGLRMQPALKAKIEEAAQTNHRSLNAEITARLEDSFRPQVDAPATVGEVMDLLMQLCEKAGRSITITFGEHEEDGED